MTVKTFTHEVSRGLKVEKRSNGEMYILTNSDGNEDNMLEGMPWLGIEEQKILKEYFRAEIEKENVKPWQDAKPGEVWLLAYKDNKDVHKIDEDYEFFIPGGAWGTVWVSITDDGITAGRRIWPEAEGAE